MKKLEISWNKAENKKSNTTFGRMGYILILNIGTITVVIFDLTISNGSNYNI